jgi:hypothetical protein
LDEADPNNWAGAGVEVKQLTKDQRGDRYWCKKNAAATLTLINKLFSLEVFRNSKSRIPGMGESVTPEQELDEEIKAAEEEAMRQLEAFQKRTSLKLVH